MGGGGGVEVFRILEKRLYLSLCINVAFTFFQFDGL